MSIQTLQRASEQGPKYLFAYYWQHKLAVTQRLRVLVRGSEIWLVVMAAVIGVVSGLGVVALRVTSHAIQALLFGLDGPQRLSAITHIDLMSKAFIPALGGLVLAGFGLWVKASKRRLVDPVEANALHGGQMSFRDSMIITGQTLISEGFGASIGLEAAYTQIGSGFASKAAGYMRARRSDIRMLVGCGAAGAIAAAFGAPLTGAFYAFELIIGTYTIASLAPVIVASIAAVLVAGLLGNVTTVVHLTGTQVLEWKELLAAAALALITGVFGIVLMVLVGRVERLFRAIKIPKLMRPAIGGIFLIPLIAITPAVLSSGHGAMQVLFDPPATPLLVLLAMIGAKVCASAISIGSGFRGGLFFASLFLGALIGQAFYQGLNMILPGSFGDPAVAALVGMTGLAAAVIGGPLTMAFLALEMSGSLPLAITVLMTAVIASLLVRETFGYSFTTWRFHLRGEAIRSAHDVGFVRYLTVGRMMRRDVKTVPISVTLTEFRRMFPLGSVKQVVGLDETGAYAGMISVPDAFARDPDPVPDDIEFLLAQRETVLAPEMNAKEAAHIFEDSASDSLAVVASGASGKVLGLLSESHLLRRYSEELDKARADLIGNRPGRRRRHS